MLRSAFVLLLVSPVAAAAPPAVTAVAYSPGGDLIAWGTHEQVALVGTEKGDARGVAKAPGRVTALAFGAKGKWLAVAAGEPGKTGVVDLHFVSERMNGFASLSAEAPTRIAAHKDSVFALAFSPDGKTLATAGYDRLIHLWDVPENGKIGTTPRLTLKDHSDTIYGLSFHPDGKLLASAGADRAVKVWDVATGKRLYTLSDPTDWVYCVAWSPDKKHLAAGGVDKSIRVWAADTEGGRLVGSAFAHEKPVWRLAYTGDGKQLYTVGEDRVIKAWDAAKLAETKTFPAQPDSVLDFALRPDGKQLAVARFDGNGLLIDPTTGKQQGKPFTPNVAPPPKPTPPKAEQLTPTGVPLGKITTVTITGKNLAGTIRISSTRQDVKTRILNRTDEAVTVEVEAPPPGNAAVTELTVVNDAGSAPPLKLALDRYPVTAERGVTDSARAAQVIKLPTSLAGSIDRAGDADFFRFEAKAGQELGVHLIAAELGSKLEPVLTLTDAGGTVLAEGTTTIGFVVPKTGTFALGVRDREYRGGTGFTYRLHLGDIPVVTGVFPLAARRGTTTMIHEEGVNLGPANLRSVNLTIPADAVVGSKFPVPVANLALGKPEVTVSDLPAVVVDPVAGAELRLPGSADGLFTKPNDSHTMRFTAKKGQRLIVETLARRAGSPVDPVIEILDAEGKPVPRAVLRCTAKTYTVFRDHDSAGPGIRIEAWNELAIDDYVLIDGDLMRIVALPKGPDDDCQFYQVAGQRLGFLGTTPAHHAQGTPVYKVEVHPAGTAFAPNGLPLFPIHYRNDDGGPGYGKDSALTFDVPADGTYQVRVTDTRGASGPTHAYRVTVRPPKPDFSVNFTPNAPAVWNGSGLPITVTVSRTDGFDGAVKVKLEGLPPGFTAPETFVEAGHNTTAFTLFAEAGATVPPDTKLRLVAKAQLDGKELLRTADGGMPKVVPVGDIVTKTSVSEIVIRPGQESRFIVTIERQGKFTGRVPVEIRGLPHGVRAMNIGLNGILITERETSREVVLYAEPWVKPMEHPIVVAGRKEGTNTEHAARSFLLQIQN